VSTPETREAIARFSMSDLVVDYFSMLVSSLW
jgi:hypothetical protein